jgi:hypothetical protein
MVCFFLNAKDAKFKRSGREVFFTRHCPNLTGQILGQSRQRLKLDSLRISQEIQEMTISFYSGKPSCQM